MKEEKKCRGIGKALGYGCGELIPVIYMGQANRKYGLGKSCHCFQKWLKQTPSGKDFAISQAVGISNKNKQERQKQSRKRFSDMKIEVYGKEHRKYLQMEINKLVRMIDNRFDLRCIDCDKVFGKQQDAGHFHSVGSDASLRWNLHNIHSQKSDCNKNGLGGGKALEYYEGLQTRYGKEYAEYVRFTLKVDFPTVKMSNREVYEKLILVRKLIRDFETFTFTDGIHARDILNKSIGIYVD